MAEPRKWKLVLVTTRSLEHNTAAEDPFFVVITHLNDIINTRGYELKVISPAVVVRQALLGTLDADAAIVDTTQQTPQLDEAVNALEARDLPMYAIVTADRFWTFPQIDHRGVYHESGGDVYEDARSLAGGIMMAMEGLTIRFESPSLRLSAEVPEWVNAVTAGEILADVVTAMSAVDIALGGNGLEVDGIEVRPIVALPSYT